MQKQFFVRLGKILPMILSSILIIGGVILQSYHPFSLSEIPVKGDWVVAQWENWIFIVWTIFCIGYLLLGYFSGIKPQNKILLSASVIVILHIAFQLLYFTIKLFFTWKENPWGKYFLPPRSTYFFDIVGRYAQPYGYAIFTALVLSFLFWITKEKIKHSFSFLGPAFGFFLGGTLGLERTWVAGIIGIILAILVMLLSKKDRVDIQPFLLIAMYIALFFGKDILSKLLA